MQSVQRSAVAALVLILAGCNAAPTSEGGSTEAPAAKSKQQPLGGTVHTDTFVQGNLIGGYADILFVVDNSCSMSDDQTRLANSFSTFINWLAQENVDFHIAITTTDMTALGAQGKFVGTPSILSNSTPNVVDAFKTNVQVGALGSPVELGFDPAIAALTAPLATTTNAGFLRPNAKLFVIFVSDEEEQSAMTVPAFVAAVRALKSDPAQVHFTSIAAEAGATCTTATLRYNELVASTGGLFGSICQNDFGTTLTQLAFEVTKASGEYFLTQLPDPQTITVTVDGVLQTPDRWTYNGGTNSVKLEPQYIPAPGVVIVITYEIAGSGNVCLKNGEVTFDLNGGEDSWKYFCVDVPAGTSQLLIHTWEGRGDADLYLKKGSKPGANDWEHRSIIEQQDETLLLTNPAPGTYYIGLYGFVRYEDVNLQPMWIGTGGASDAGTSVPDAGTVVDAGTVTDAGTVVDAGTPAIAHLVISGVGYDTPGVDEFEEFVEIYNPTAAAVSLDGLKLSDNSGVWPLPQGLSIAPGSYQTIARNAAGFTTLYGKSPSISGMTLNLSNSGDWMMLQDAAGTTVDFVAWENATPGWSLTANSGSALQRTNAAVDTDLPADWSVSTVAAPR